MAKHKNHDADTTNESDIESTPTPVPTQTLVIAGLTFTVQSPYAEGHALTPGEARALNQTRAENLRNNFAKKVQEAKGENATVPDDVWQKLAAELAEYESTYSFEKVRSSAPRQTHIDPVEKEAHRQAAHIVEAALNARNIAKKNIKPENFKALVAEVLLKRPEIREASRRHVEALSAIGHEAISALEDSTLEFNAAA
jgi:hypothetical protein